MLEKSTASDEHLSNSGDPEKLGQYSSASFIFMVFLGYSEGSGLKFRLDDAAMTALQSSVVRSYRKTRAFTMSDRRWAYSTRHSRKIKDHRVPNLRPQTDSQL